MATSKRKRALTSPHDALFRWTFSQRAHAVGLLKAALPEAVVKAVRWSTVRVEAGSFVDAALRRRYSDLVLSARMGAGRVYFYTVIEQQRDVEPLMVFRMGVYMIRLWEQLVRSKPRLRTLPPVMPVLIHHSEKGWTAATSFHELIAGEGPERAALLPHIPSFRVRLVDVSGGRASDLVEQALTALGKVVLWCLSVAGDDTRLEREMSRIAEALDEVLRAADGPAALEALLRYLVATHKRLSVKKVGRTLEKAAGPRAREVIVTVLDRIERRGERKGRARMLLELLDAKFGEVPSDMRKRILGADEATLTAWTGRFLPASTLHEVIGDDSATPPRPPARKRSR